MNEKDVFSLCDRICETAFSLHKYLRHGHLEKVYERGLFNRLPKAGIAITALSPVSVRDEDGTILGGFVADFFGEDCLLIEIKACRSPAEDHTAQLLGYLRASGFEHGLLINFGAPRLEIKKFALPKPF